MSEPTILWAYGQPWVDLRPAIIEATRGGADVLWISGSGTRLVLMSDGGDLTRTRFSHQTHDFDEWPCQLEEPWFATACGLGDGTGYRSTPPLIVAAIPRGTPDRSAVVRELWERAVDLAEQVNASPTGEWRPPDTHPEKFCGAMRCPRRPGPIAQLHEARARLQQDQADFED